MLYPRKLCKFKKQQSVSLWNFLVNTLLLHIPLLTLTDGQRNKYTRCTWAGGTFFQLCCCVNFWFWWEICFGFTYLCTQSTIQLWHCVIFLVWREIVFGISYVLSVQYTCVVESVFVVVGKSVVAGNRSQNENTFRQKKNGLLYHDPLADVCIS